MSLPRLVSFAAITPWLPIAVAVLSYPSIGRADGEPALSEADDVAGYALETEVVLDAVSTEEQEILVQELGYLIEATGITASSGADGELDLEVQLELLEGEDPEATRLKSIELVARSLARYIALDSGADADEQIYVVLEPPVAGFRSDERLTVALPWSGGIRGDLESLSGIIRFDIANWQDASGHFDLWGEDGSEPWSEGEGSPSAWGFHVWIEGYPVVPYLDEDPTESSGQTSNPGFHVWNEISGKKALRDSLSMPGNEVWAPGFHVWTPNVEVANDDGVQDSTETPSKPANAGKAAAALRVEARCVGCR
jgi:hypothetical protein